MRRAHVVLARQSLRLARRQRYAAAHEDLAAALRASGELALAPRALPYEAWPREASGAPALLGGWHASFSDTVGLAVAVVAPFALALDVEARARPRWEAARERFRESGELGVLASESQDDVLALWSAKEALLKLARVGLADLARVMLLGRTGERFTFAYAGREHEVAVHALEAHFLAVASAEPLELALHELQESP